MTRIRNVWNTITCRPCMAIGLLLLLTFVAGDVFAGIGEGARNRAAEAGPIVDPNAKSEAFDMMVTAVKGLAFLLLLLVLFLTSRISRLVDYDPFRSWNADVVNGRVFALFGILFGAFVAYEMVHHTDQTIKESATEHGQQIDFLFNTTLLITGIAFVLVQFAIFYFAAKYKYSTKRKALYYPDNHKLELVWTLIPAVVLAVIVLYGVKIWEEIHHPDYAGKEPVHIELVGEQFKWTIRHGGEDNKLGKYDFKMIDGTNPLGLDSADKANHDDKLVITKELHLPLNTPITLHARSKDVLHGMFIPHFAVNVYAVPGMPTQFSFIAKKSTAEMRKETGNPDFNYELACGQLCGSGHWNMKMIIVVEDEKSYKTWLAEQKEWMAPPEEEKEEEEATAEEPAPTAMNNTAPTN